MALYRAMLPLFSNIDNFNLETGHSLKIMVNSYKYKIVLHCYSCYKRVYITDETWSIRWSQFSSDVSIAVKN